MSSRLPFAVRFALPVVAAIALVGCSTVNATDRVVFERVYDGGIQPQAVTDPSGIVHIVFFKGDPAAGDLYYVRRRTDGTRSTPIRVNSQQGSAVALGSVRGAQIALGRNSRVHIVWNGSDRTRPQMSQGMPLLYARS